MRKALLVPTVLLFLAGPVQADPVEDAALQAQALTSAPEALWGSMNSDGDVYLEWVPSSLKGDLEVIEYRVYRYDLTDPTAPVTVTTIPDPDNQFIDVDVDADALYLYTVTAVYFNQQESLPSIPTILGSWPPCSAVKVWIPPPQPGFGVYPQCLIGP